MPKRTASTIGRDEKALQKAFPWYKPESYARAEDLSVLEWSLLLEYRQRALNSSGDDLEWIFRTIKESPLAVRQFPIPEPAVEELSTIEWRRLSALHELTPIRTDVDAWFAKYGRFAKGRYLAGILFQGWPRPQSLHEIILEMYAESSKKESEARDIYDSVLSRAVVFVDLRIGDDYLIRAFKSWLVRKRAAMNKAGYMLDVPIARKEAFKEFRPADFKRWAEVRVLDYLDVCIACRVAGEEAPTDPELAALLLPNYLGRRASNRNVDQAEVIRKQTKKHAGMVMRPDVLRLLHQQGLLEWESRESPA